MKLNYSKELAKVRERLVRIAKEVLVTADGTLLREGRESRRLVSATIRQLLKSERLS